MMNEKETKKDKRQVIFISVILLLIFGFVAVGVTFAYFSISVRGNESASSIIVKTANIGEVVFTDGNEILLEDAYPNMFATRTFTVSYSDDGEISSLPINYQVFLIQSANTFAQNGITEFVHWIDSALIGEDPGEDATSKIGTSKETATTVPAAGSSLAILEGTLVPGTTHTITYSVGLKENDQNQNSAQDKVFVGRLYVSVDGTTGLTADDYGSIVEWSSNSN